MGHPVFVDVDFWHEKLKINIARFARNVIKVKITSLLNPACGNPTLFPGANGCDPNGDLNNLSNSSSSLLFISDPIRNGVATPIVRKDQL